MKQRIVVRIVFIILIVQVDLCSQVLPFRHYTRKEGLVANDITTLHQDSLKYLWIGTANGISRYDGTRFENFTTFNGLPSNFIDCFSEWQDWLWIGTNGGLCRTLSGRSSPERTFQSFRLDSLDDPKKIYSLLHDGSGTLWCATEKGVYRIRGDSVSEFLFNGKHLNARFIVRTPDSTIWIDDESQLILHHPVRSTSEKIELRLGTGITGMTADRSGNVWIATNDSVLHQYYNGMHVVQRRLNASVRSISVDGTGTLWISTHIGLFSIHKDQFQSEHFLRYTTANGLMGNMILCTLIDHENSLWTAQQDRGVSILSEKQFHIFRIEGIPQTTNSGRAAADTNGHFWAVTAKGVEEIWQEQHGEWKTFSHAITTREKKGDFISVRYSDNGRLWIHTRSRVYEIEIIPHIRSRSSLRILKTVSTMIDAKKKTAMFILPDSKGNVWCSYIGYGVVRIDPSKRPRRVQTYTHKNGLPSDDIRVIFEDREKNVWFGGFNSGIAILPNGTDKIVPFAEFYGLSKDQSLPDNMIRTIAQDSKGKIWIGMRYHGIAVLENGKIKTISTGDGLVNNTIWAFAEDAEGRMWVGTALGVQAVSIEMMQPIQQKEILMGSPVASCGTQRHGFIWYTTPDAFKVFRDDPELRSIDPPVYITRLDVNTTSVPLTSGSEFPSDHNNINVEFSGISFRGLEPMQFQYRLSGAHEQWSNKSAQRSASYLGLNPGTYTFQVRGITNEGDISLHPDNFSFVVLPPFWMTWWFRSLSIIVFLSAGPIVYVRRVKQLQKEKKRQEDFSKQLIDSQEDERKRIASELHDSIGQNLLYIKNSAVLGKNKKDLKRYADISETASLSIEEVRRIAYNLFPYQLDRMGLTKAIESVVRSIGESSSIQCQMSIGNIDGKFTKEQESSIFRIVQECLNNIVKHSGADRMTLLIGEGNGAVSITVGDNGCGYDSLRMKNESKGFGLKNIHNRVSLLQGNIVYSSSQEFTTLITITLPVVNGEKNKHTDRR